MISVIHGLISFMIIFSVLILIESCPELCESLSLGIICKVLSLLIKANLKFCLVDCSDMCYMMDNNYLLAHLWYILWRNDD